MKTISEQNFKAILDALWVPFAKSIDLVSSLESIGLEVTRPADPAVDGFSNLYTIQDTAAKAILKFFDIDSERLSSDEGTPYASVKSQTVLENLDQFLFDVYTECPDYENFPEKYYPKLLRILTVSCGAKLPWVETEHLIYSMPERYRRHRALSVNDRKPVMGYLWNGSDHAYIIPGNSGICYDEDTHTLSAHAVEVFKETIAVDMQLCDDSMTPLFEGDTVRIGDDRFVLKLSDMDVLKCLTSPDRKEKGLYRVRANYEDHEL